MTFTLRGTKICNNFFFKTLKIALFLDIRLLPFCHILRNPPFLPDDDAIYQSVPDAQFENHSFGIVY